MRPLITFLFLVGINYISAQSYSCAGGDQVELKNLTTNSSGPGCLVSLEVDITAVNYGNWSWSGGGSSGGFWLATTSDPQPVNIGPFYINKNCGNLAGETVSLKHMNTNTLCTPIPLSGLPITLHSFNITSIGDSHRAEWRANVENTTEYFEVEISEDGRDWRRWLSVVGIAGDHEYDAFLPYIKSGNLYVRLKMLTGDGGYQYSKIQVLSTDRDPFLIYPSLVARGGTINLYAGKKMEWLQLFNLNGTVVYQGEVINGTLRIPTTIATGMYLVKANTPHYSMQKIFIQ